MEPTPIKNTFEKKIKLFNTHFTNLIEICKRVIEQKLKYDDYKSKPVYVNLEKLEKLYTGSCIISDNVKKFINMFERYFNRNSNALLDPLNYDAVIRKKIIYLADEEDKSKEHLLMYNIDFPTIYNYALELSEIEKGSIENLELTYMNMDLDTRTLLLSPKTMKINLYRILHTCINDEEIKAKLRLILNPLEDEVGYIEKTVGEETLADSISTIYSKIRGGIDALPFISEEQKKKIPDSNQIGGVINNIISSEGTKKFTQNLFNAFESGQLTKMSKSLINKMVEENALDTQDETTKEFMNLISPLVSEFSNKSESMSKEELIEQVNKSTQAECEDD